MGVVEQVVVREHVLEQLKSEVGFEVLVMSLSQEMGLGKNNGGRTSLVSTRGNRGKFGLGYKLTQADIRKSVAGRKSRSQGSQLGRQVEGGLPCHISRSFISASLGHDGQVVAICKDDSPSGSNLVRPCPPGFRLGNWRVEELPNIYVTSIM